ncbi:MAG TPA: Dyp-type peroxidase [Microbacteriaceae bacterium]
MISRRGFLSATAIAGVSTAAGASLGAVGASYASNVAAETATADRSELFRGAHQSGIETKTQAVTNFIAFDLRADTNKADARRWMSLITDDIERLSKGQPVLADPAPELAVGAARLTATVGFGMRFFQKLGLESQIPSGFIDLPSFKMDRLDDRYSGGDVLIHVSADDPIVLANASRALIRDSMPFANVRWMQKGFTHSPGMVPAGVSHRNLMGQVDGTENPKFGSQDFKDLVWIDSGPEWIRGGTLLVLRRIAMQLDTWDQLGTPEKEEVIGRNLSNGAPLTGVNENDVPDLNARYPNGLKVIPDFAHIRRAAPSRPGERIFRRPFSYHEGVSSNGSPDVGLLWTAYQKNIETQYLPIQKRLEQLDLLNEWTVPIGSATFAIPKGVMQGETLAEALLL